MFDQLSERLQGVLAGVRDRGRLTPEDVKLALREVRLALLEADVNFQVVKSFTSDLGERLDGAEVSEALNPGQEVVKAVQAELTELLGGSAREMARSSSGTTVVLMAGLQGSGKTTACGKLARMLGEDGQDVAVAACDLQRPAAVEQLEQVADRAGAGFYGPEGERDPVAAASRAAAAAKADGRDFLIVDTAGRTALDDELLDELAAIKRAVKPHDVLLVLDSMTGQEAVGVAEAFAGAADFDGIVLTKLDGDARGGAALSVRAVTGKPILYASTGERLEDIERFHPDRMAGRILGMGDVMSLIERAEKQLDSDRSADLERKIREESFTFDDFLEQMKQVRGMGPLSGLLKMIPGMEKAMGGMGDIDESELDRVEAIVLSMTHWERANPERIDGSRRKRIAEGSGTSVQAVNRLLKQFTQMRKMMKKLAGGRMPSPEELMRGAR